MPIIILDGPRGAGKSKVAINLIAHLKSEKKKVRAFKRLRPIDPFREMEQSITKFQIESDVYHVCDRFSLTELIFSSYHKRVPQAELEAHIWHIHDMLAIAKAKYYVLLASVNTLDKRIKQRDDGKTWDMPQSMVLGYWQNAVQQSHENSRLKIATIWNEDGFLQDTIHRIISDI